MLVMRKVAQAASAGFVKSDDFEKFWPGPKGEQKETPSWATTTPEERKKIIEKLKNGK